MIIPRSIIFQNQSFRNSLHFKTTHLRAISPINSLITTISGEWSWYCTVAKTSYDELISSFHHVNFRKIKNPWHYHHDWRRSPYQHLIYWHLMYEIEYRELKINGWITCRYNDNNHDYLDSTMSTGKPRCIFPLLHWLLKLSTRPYLCFTLQKNAFFSQFQSLFHKLLNLCLYLFEWICYGESEYRH